MRTFLARVAALVTFSLLGPLSVHAQAVTYDPYADSVHSASSTGVSSQSESLGAPDGQATRFVGINKFIVLDMGLNEEGTGNLRVYFGELLVSSSIRVDFLDAGLQTIKSETSDLSVSTSPQSRDYPYSFGAFNKAYRYVRLTNLAEAGFAIDAVEAQAYIGSTPTTDTDGDGTPDRTETQNGTNPQVVNSSSSSSSSSSSTSNPPSSPSCDRDVWVCSEWSLCSQSGESARECAMGYDCPGVATPAPSTNRSCTPLPSFTPPPQSPAPSPAPAPGSSPTPVPVSAPAPDVQSPVISSVHASTFSSTSELIEWKTDEGANSQVEYGPENGPTMLSPLDPNMVMNHSIILSGLEPGVIYNYRVFSRDQAGNLANSPEAEFRMPSGAVANVISDVQSWLSCGQWNYLLLALLILSLIGNLVQHSHVRQMNQDMKGKRRNGSRE